MSEHSPAQRFGLGFLWVMLLGLVLLGSTTGCEEALDGSFGGSISNFTIEPNRIPKIERGMGDEFFQVSMTVAGFDTPVTGVALFVQETGWEAPLNPERELIVTGSTVEVRNLAKSWFSQAQPDIYTIGATVTAEDGSQVTQRNLATVEVYEP